MNNTELLELMMSDETATGAMDRLKASLKNRGSGTNIFYRYKTMPYGSSCTVRFLAAYSETSENDVQPEFWVPKKVVRLRFENPEQEGSEVALSIPVMQMYTKCKTENDLVLKQAKALFDEADRLRKQGKEEEAKQVHAKGSYHWTRGECLAQIFVNRSSIVENDIPENPIRLVELGKQVMNVINATLNSDDPAVKLDYWPCHGRVGTDFVIKKTQSGDYPKYDAGSCFARQTSPWTTEQIAAFGKYGLWRLEDFLPPRPTDTEYELLAQIVKASIDGEKIWNPDWEDHFETVKVFKTNQGDRSEVDTDTLQVQVRNAMSHLSGTTSATEVLSSLSRTTAPDDDEDSRILEDEENVEVAQPATPTKSAEQVRSVVEQIKNRTRDKTASAD